MTDKKAAVVSVDEATDEPVEGEVREEEAVPERGLVRAPVQSSVIVGGTAALAAMSDETFEENLASLQKVRARVDRIKKALMVDGVDYGPPFAGSNKDVLLKPGTETLLRSFGLADSYRIDQQRGNGETEPDLAVTAFARIHIGDTAGPVIAEGVGQANTWETKHRYRGNEARTCPDCGKVNVIHSRPPRNGWWCGTRDGGCGHSFAEDDPRITAQLVGKAENPDPWDLANTVVKMAKKRALVDGVLTATGSSGLFSQDEDAPGGSGAGRGNAPQQPPAGAPAATTTSAAPSGPGPGNAAPGASEEPLPAGVIQAVVAEAPEAAPREAKSERWDGTRLKLEVKTKVGARKHTAMVTGPLAEAAAMAKLQVDEVVRFIGAIVYEHKWSDDPKKPLMKQVWGTEANKWFLTDLQVMRNGEWWSVNSAMPTLLPTADASSEAASSSTSSDAAPSSPESTTTSTQPTSSPAPSAERMKGAPGTWDNLSGQLVDPIQFTVKGVTPVAILRVADKATGAIIMAAVGEDIEGQVGTAEAPFIEPGGAVQLYGEWTETGWLIVSAVGKPA